MKKALLPFFITLAFLFESIFVELLPAELFKNTRIIIPHFLMVLLIFTTIYASKNHGILYCFIFGLLFDIVYTEIIGIHLFMLPLVAYIASWLMKILQTNIIIVSLVALVSVALLEMGVYEMNFLINKTDMIFSTFVDIRLVPTLILNFIFIIIIAFPFKKYCELFAEALRND